MRINIKIHQVILIFIVCFSFSVILSVLNVVIYPSARTGPFGIGLPAPTKKVTGKFTHMSMNIPNSWVLAETPSGNHGDLDVFAQILIPGRSFPQVTFYNKKFSVSDESSLINWATSKSKPKNQYQMTGSTVFTTSKYTGVVQRFSWLGLSILLPDEIILCNAYIFFIKDMGYSVNFCAREHDWSKVEKVFQDIMESISLE